MDSPRQALQSIGKLFSIFQKFKFVFDLLAKNRKKYSSKYSEALILIKVQCVIYQWIRLDKLYKLMIFFFQIRFRIIGQKPKNIQANSEACILIKVQCICYTSMDLSRQALQTNV